MWNEDIAGEIVSCGSVVRAEWIIQLYLELMPVAYPDAFFDHAGWFIKRGSAMSQCCISRIRFKLHTNRPARFSRESVPDFVNLFDVADHPNQCDGNQFWEPKYHAHNE